MNKLLAVIKREYFQRIRSRMFLITTILGPVMLLVFTIVPSLIFNLKTGGPTKIAIVDQSGRLYDRVSSSILRDDAEVTASAESPDELVAKRMGSEGRNGTIDAAKSAAEVRFQVEQAPKQRDLAETKNALNIQVKNGELDGYIVIPADVFDEGAVEFYARNLSDVITRSKLRERISRAVIEQRLIDANIAPEVVRKQSESVKLRQFPAGGSGREDKGGAFASVFIVGFLIYVTILMYGQAILGAVVEEKETRIAEILFSSVKSFTLLIGKLMGVSLVALTQLAIWGIALAAFAAYGVAMLVARGMDMPDLQLRPLILVYFVLFFLLGYFLYATVYALVGSMVTTAQEGGQLALPIVFTLLAGFYLAIPIIQKPDTSFAFWMSMVPFFSPIVMMVRILTQPPPIWQVALSLVIGFSTILLIMWLASRIYRIGMLMYGKKASIPEVMRWIRQA